MGFDKINPLWVWSDPVTVRQAAALIAGFDPNAVRFNSSDGVCTELTKVPPSQPQKAHNMAQHTDTSALHDALKNFDSLPDSANVRQPVVAGLMGCSGTTVWRMVKKGILPAPRKLSERVTAWNVGELRQALAAA
jgi:predicted DNA-binding transcriptional regulator AlpA